MEPQIIDYYNELPNGINVIDKMNEELDKLQKIYNELKIKHTELGKKHTEYVKTHKIETMPKIRVNTIDELKIYAENIYNSTEIFKKIIYDFLNHEGWILVYDSPDRGTTGLMGYNGCGFWDSWEIDDLIWGNTTAQSFYSYECNTSYYNLYLKCKILDELYKLFPEYTERKRGWFHQQIDKCFDEVSLIITTILENDCNMTKEQLHNMIYKIIMKKLFGYVGTRVGEPDLQTPADVIADVVELLAAIPNENDNSDYIYNIIYYECCRYQLLGDEFFIETDITDSFCWHEFVRDEFVGEIIINQEISFTCPNCGT